MRHPNDQPRDIVLPSRLGLDETFRFALNLGSLKGRKEVHIDLGPEKYISPFTMLFVGLVIKKFCHDCPQSKVILHNFSRHTYMGYMGFFDLCGADHGKAVREDIGAGDHIPITAVRRGDFYESNLDKYQELPDLIQRHVDRLAEVVVRNRSQIQSCSMHSPTAFARYLGTCSSTARPTRCTTADSIGLRQAKSK